jgi:ankyrin repeat protein
MLILACRSAPRCYKMYDVGYLHATDKETCTDTADRKKLQLLLTAFAQFGANLNTLESKEQIGAIHMAAIANNSRAITWLVKWNANKELLSVKDKMSPMMYAAKYGSVLCLAELVRQGVNVNHSSLDICPPSSLPSIADSPTKNLLKLTKSAGYGEIKLEAAPIEGRTPLHYAAFFGQTRSAMFLMRVGASAKLRDKEGKLAAELALQSKAFTTAQQISSFAVAKPTVALQLEFLVKEDDEMIDKERRKNLFNGLFSAAESLQKGFGILWRALSRPVVALANCLFSNQRTKAELAELEAENNIDLDDLDDNGGGGFSVGKTEDATVVQQGTKHDGKFVISEDPNDVVLF